ncbi:ligand-binding sensor domain-containing protein [Lutibacter agarilyticus]|uniref:ligand-binding sensor domain-containing protein n=1 Tax=Lutibacter agarilyticus TaxID=1109740 RepID=UPI001595FF75|nr:two-component regulator propeller domain-containing protein [Lutibacter agarilyticus]
MQLNVKDMALDELGYLWAGTEDGLHRFNGYEFKTYLHNPLDSSSIKDDHVRGLLFTKDTLWVATNSKGILGFVPSENRFFSIKKNENIDLNISYKIMPLDEKELLFSVKNNLILFNRPAKNSKIIKLPETTKDSYISAILKIDINNYWLANTTGILILNTKTYDVQKTTTLEGENIKCFYKNNNNIYIGTENGLFIYNILNQQISKTPLTFSINCFNKLQENQFYIGSDKGLFLYDILEESITPFVLKINENKLQEKIDINQIINDEKGNLWFGSDGEGLYHYNSFQKKFNTIKLSLKEYPLMNNISSFQFLKGKDSTLWIGTKYGIVKYFHKNKNFKLYATEGDPLIYAITKDKNNTIWGGGFTTGLLKYDANTDSFIKIQNTKNNLPDDDIVDIIPIDNNTLWVATWAGGIHKFDIKNENFEEVFINGKRINRARTSLIDSKKNIWLGTDQGVFKISKSGIIQNYNEEGALDQKLSGNRVFNIKEDYNGNIWIGTNTGLTKLDIQQHKTTLFYKQKGLPNDFIYSILIAKNNDIWVSTNYGISVLNTETNKFKNYTTSDGLQNNEFNGKAGYKDQHDNFYFGGISGINIFKATNIKENQNIPEIYIESVDLFNEPLQKNELYKNVLAFKSDENVLTFNFSALNYLNPEKCSYTYMMEGFDNDWRPITNSRNTTYTNLNPGKYTFKVKASNDVGVWNDVPATIAIVIIPPWYQTTLFRFSFVILFLLSGISFYFYKTTRLKRDKLKLEKIVTQRTQEILGKNEALKLAYNKSEKQRDSIKFLMRELTHRVKNNLQIISSLLNIQANTSDNKEAIDALKIAKNRILAIAHLESKMTIEKETIKIDEFIKELSQSIITALSDDEKLNFTVIYDLADVYIKKVNTVMIGLILNELITNTTKYAFDDFKPENKLSISCKFNKTTLRLIISDNGKGYSLQKDVLPKSLGIELVTEMVNQLNATITINSTKGTENIIEIPI